VVIVGYRLNAKEPAAKALERILGLSPQDARHLARSFPALVARGLIEGQAAALAEQLRAAGANVELRAAEGDAPPAKSAKPPPSPLAPPAERKVQVAVEAAAGDAGARGAATGTLEPQDLSGSYQLGDFGFARPAAKPKPEPKAAASSASVSVELPAPAPVQPPARAPGDDLSLDFATDEALALELDEPAPRSSRMELGGSSGQAASKDLHALGERLDDLAPSAPIPQVEERAFRAIQQRGPRHEVRRSSPPIGRATRLRRALLAAIGAWLPSTLMFTLLCVASALAVGYALDPDDIVGALRREVAAPAFASQRERPAARVAAERAVESLHPLLRAAPSSVRGPLAAILRARISGVHQVPVSFAAEQGRDVDCVLMEEPSAPDQARLEALRATGQPVEPPSAIAAQLREHARALQGSATKPAVLTPLCLAL
jgi:hypothetical protein